MTLLRSLPRSRCNNTMLHERSPRAVVITGMGAITGSGLGVKPLWQDVINARSRITRVTLEKRTYLGVPASLDDECVEWFRKIGHYDRYAVMGFIAAQLALRDAEWTQCSESTASAGIVMGTGFGAMGTIENTHRTLFEAKRDRVRPMTLPLAMSNSVGALMAQSFQFHGPNLIISTACSSSAHAVGIGSRLIEQGICDAVVVGGTDAPLLQGVFASWDALGVLAPDQEPPTEGLRPFDRDRQGVVLGEGAGVVVLEAWSHARKRNRSPYALICGYGASADGKHLTRPDSAGMALAMTRCLANAQCPPDFVDYIQAHGTGTVANDTVECEALESVFDGRTPPVSSSKPITGHTMGAAGILGLIIAIMSLEKKTIPPTANLRSVDPQCQGVTHVVNPVATPLNKILVNAFGFGGNNASLLIESIHN